MKELNERLETRGAADEHIWKWCENIIAHNIKQQKKLAKKTPKRKGVKKPVSNATIKIKLNRKDKVKTTTVCGTLFSSSF